MSLLERTGLGVWIEVPFPLSVRAIEAPVRLARGVDVLFPGLGLVLATGGSHRFTINLE